MWNSCNFWGLPIKFHARYQVGSGSYPFQLTRYFNVPLTSLQASTSLISHLSLPLTWIGKGGLFLCPSSGSIAAFHSLFGEKTKWTLIEFGSFILYELPIFSK